MYVKKRIGFWVKEGVFNRLCSDELCREPQQFGIISVLKIDFGYLSLNLIFLIFYCIY
jgi:hypothetical protein